MLKSIPTPAAMLFAGALLSASPVMAQDALVLCSDRPGNATPTCVVSSGTIQLETSLVDWTHDEDARLESQSFLFGDSLVKVGIGAETEVRVSFTPYQYNRIEAFGRTSTFLGFGDVGLSARHRLVNGGDKGVSFSVQPFVSLPVGNEEVSAGTWSAGLVAPVDIPLGQVWTFNLSPAIAAQADSDGDGRHLLYAATAAIGRPVASNIAATFELFAQRDRDPAGTLTVVTADGMLAWQPLADTQFDVSSYVGLTDDTPGIELIVGVTQRFR